MNKFWEFKNAASDQNSAELLLYGVIADISWLEDTVSSLQFNKDLAALGDVKNITVRINSRGGDVFAAHAIYNSLVQHSAKITVRIDGLAASAATIVALAGDTIIMPENALMLVHNPFTSVGGDARDMRKMADALDTIRQSILAIYCARTGLSEAELIDAMDNDTWYTADEAVASGFADKVERNVKVKASYVNGVYNLNGLSLDISAMKMVPVALMMSAISNTVSPPDDGVGDNTAQAAAVQNNLEGDHMSVTSKKYQPGEEPIATPATEPTESPAEIASRERARVLAIQKLATPGAEEIIEAALANGDSPQDTAYAIFNSGAVNSANLLAARKVDAQAAVVDGIPVEGAAEAAAEDRIAKMATAGNKHLSFTGRGVK